MGKAAFSSTAASAMGVFKRAFEPELWRQPGPNRLRWYPSLVFILFVGLVFVGIGYWPQTGWLRQRIQPWDGVSVKGMHSLISIFVSVGIHNETHVSHLDDLLQHLLPSLDLFWPRQYGPLHVVFDDYDRLLLNKKYRERLDRVTAAGIQPQISYERRPTDIQWPPRHHVYRDKNPRPKGTDRHEWSTFHADQHATNPLVAICERD